MTTLSALDRALLRTIDGQPAHLMEFEERCRLRTLSRWGIRVTADETRRLHVDWSSVHDAKRHS